MKQSLDENTITLKNGRTFQAVKMESGNNCKSCDFNKFSFEDFCENIFCNGFEREDRQDVYFVEVKK